MRDPAVRREIQRAAIWLGMAGAIILLALLVQPILLIVAGMVFAAILDGGTRLLGRVLPIARGWRLAIILLSMVVFAVWMVSFAGSQIAAQAAELQRLLLDQGNAILAWGRSHGFDELNIDPQQAISYVAGSVGRVTAAVGILLGGITNLVMIFVLGLFFAMEPRLYERGFAWLLPISERAHFYDVSRAVGATMRRLMAGRLLGMLVEGVATWLLLAAYDIPLAALLGLITGLLVFIPNIGAILSGVLMVLVGLSVGPEGGLYALIVYFVVQTVDGYVIVPMVAKRTVDLAPALVLGAQLLFGALFGILGLALADPIVAAIKVALEKNAARGARAEVASHAAQATETKMGRSGAARRIATRLSRDASGD
ncbi:MAG: AI-2E family transporter [Sphingomonadaceae bacterium]|nr:AI-2E family transporter [Sphingomonadaceae bacterium]